MASDSPVLLGIETSGNSCCAGLARGAQLLAESAFHMRNKHSEQLGSTIAGLLSLAGLGYEQLNGIVLSAGPGSFTGLRIGYSLAKGLAHGLKIPIVEVPTLSIWAIQCGWQNRPVVALIDARREEAFCQTFYWRNGWIDSPSEAQLVPLSHLATTLPPGALLTGGDALRLEKNLPDFQEAQIELLRPQPPNPQVWALMTEGFRRYQQGDFADTANCEPLYIRTFQGHT